MRFLHTSDWHLGRIFHGVHLTEDQSHVLEQLVQVIKDSQVDAVVIAGDIYAYTGLEYKRKYWIWGWFGNLMHGMFLCIG